MITTLLLLAAVGFTVTVWVCFRVLVALRDFCDWWERGNNPFGIPFEEAIGLRIAAGTLAPNGKRWTAATLKVKESKDAALKAHYLAYRGNLWEICATPPNRPQPAPGGRASLKSGCRDLTQEGG
jgi:hypothetical protein